MLLPGHCCTLRQSVAGSGEGGERGGEWKVGERGRGNGKLGKGRREWKVGERTGRRVKRQEKEKEVKWKRTGGKVKR